jgi:membrane associated rhomboid family serine protease
MTSSSGVPVTGPETSEETYCYLHPDTPTKLRCTRCDRPICGRCAIPASVGQHCPNCVAEARRSAPKVRSALRATAPVVMTILIVNVVMWVIQTAAPGQPETPYDVVTFALGALSERIAAGEWYRLITPMFLHAPDSLWHIGFNSYALFLFGPNMEQALGKRRFLILYLVAGFMGSAVSYTFGSCGRIGVGASGAIFGVLGGLFVFLYNRRRSTFVRQYMRNIILLIGVNLVFGFVFPGIDNLAHMGGLVGGAALGLSLDEAPGRMIPRRLQLLGVLGVVVAGIALVAWRTATFSC